MSSRPDDGHQVTLEDGDGLASQLNFNEEPHQVALEFYRWAILEGWGPRRILREIGCPPAEDQWLTEATILAEIAKVWVQLRASQRGGR